MARDRLAVRMRPGRERGSATVVALGVLLALAAVAVAGLLAAAVVRATHAAAAAADLAALAGATALRDTGSAGAACSEAARLAHENGAELQTCRPTDGRILDVVVAVPLEVTVPGLPDHVVRASRAGPDDPLP